MLELEQNNKTKAVVVCPIVLGDRISLTPENRLNEAVCLAHAIQIEVVASQTVQLKEIKSATYFSKGFVEKILPLIEEYDIFLMVVDAALTPIQQRNLEKALKIKVIDRTALILEIFGERAQTSEGKLQVELAHLTYQRSRLVRSWTHLERQRGGAGFLGGPGEKQIELDKRIIDDKIIKIKKELEKVKNTRTLHRSNRKKVPYPVVALVGYTNVGKSSLFNALTKDCVMVADMLFATLDPVLRKIKLLSGAEVIISDTVGFISNLPHELVMAFRSTLEEVLQADIVVHVRDISNPDTNTQRKDVLDVLHHLGLNEIESQKNYIEVFNKTDLLSSEEMSALLKKTAKNPNTFVALSALTGFGCEKLLELIEQKLTDDMAAYGIQIPVTDGKAVSLIYRFGTNIIQHQSEDELTIFFRANQKNIARLKATLPHYTIYKKE